MEPPQNLKRLAEILRLRKDNSNPYNLLLTSTISLTPEVLQGICGSNDWYTFCAWMQQHGVEDRLAILKLHLKDLSDQEGYHALAQLVKEGYFSTVLTANADSSLENALFDTGVRSYERLVLPRDTDDYVARTLERQPRGIRVVQLRGSVAERSITESFPEVFDMKYPLKKGLDEYLNQDIVIVGSIEREDDLRRLLNYSKRTTIYYVTPQEPSNDEVVKAIRGRGNNPSSSLIYGPYGQFDKFFKFLASVLLNHPQVASNKIISPQQLPTITYAEEKPIPIPSPTLQQERLEGTSEGEADMAVEAQGGSELSSIQQSESRHTSIPLVVEKADGSASSLVRIGITLLFTVAGIGVIFFIVSVFSNNTNIFNNSFSIIVLLVVVATIILGVLGLLNAEQVTHLLSLGLGSSSDSKTDKSKADNKKASDVNAPKK
jgi:hypothetical protein